MSFNLIKWYEIRHLKTKNNKTLWAIVACYEHRIGVDVVSVYPSEAEARLNLKGLPTTPKRAERTGRL